MALKEEINIDNIYQHSKRVQRLYKICIGFIVLGVLILGVQLIMNSNPSADDGSEIVADSSEMLAPQYRGKTEDGYEFLITSEKAKEIEDGLILLSSPIANVFEDEKLSNFILDSVSGLYDSEEKILMLSESVELDDDEGNSFKASEIKLDLEKNVISSDNKIDLNGKIGKITADGLEIQGKGDVIIFKGKSKMIINEMQR